jgi:chemotaxis protein MotB
LQGYFSSGGEGIRMENKAPIIIIKRKARHAEHHGGAWKVAYADFVTAMMALFIVLWLLNTSKQMQEAIGGYFKDPTGTSKMVGTNLAGSGENFVVTKNNLVQLKEELEKAVHKMSNFDKLKNQITMTVTAEGLRIELMETEKGTFFDLGSRVPNQNGTALIVTLAEELGHFPNKLSIEGHTDSRPFATKGEYTNWELSADRANATRKLMQVNGVRADQVNEVRGFADQRLKIPSDPYNPINRRISLLIQYLPSDGPPMPLEKGKNTKNMPSTPPQAKPAALGGSAIATPLQEAPPTE